MFRRWWRLALVGVACACAAPQLARAQVTTVASASVLVFPRVIVDGTWETTVQISSDANLLAKAPAHLREELAEDSTPRLWPTWRRRAWRSAARVSCAARRRGPASR